MRKRDVLDDRSLHQEPEPLAVFRQERDTGGERIARGAELHTSTTDEDRSRVATVGTIDNAGDLRPAAADQSSEADNFTTTDSQRYVTDAAAA